MTETVCHVLIQFQFSGLFPAWFDERLTLVECETFQRLRRGRRWRRKCWKWCRTRVCATRDAWMETRRIGQRNCGRIGLGKTRCEENEEKDCYHRGGQHLDWLFPKKGEPEKTWWGVRKLIGQTPGCRETSENKRAIVQYHCFDTFRCFGVMKKVEMCCWLKQSIISNVRYTVEDVPAGSETLRSGNKFSKLR